ncbi:MAG: LysE family translocator [Sphingopyxis sp.]
MNQLWIVYGAYILATASPGPSNMAIMATAMGAGRAPALILAAGVVSGSMFWAMLAATGLTALLENYAWALTFIKVAGGLYLLYLGYKSARSAMLPMQIDTGVASQDASPQSHAMLYRRGLYLHLGNPKAVLAWVAIMSLGLRSDAPSGTLWAIIGGCAALGSLVFGGYALLFSTPPMVRAYRASRRWVDGALALFFGFAGFKLLLSRS